MTRIAFVGAAAALLVTLGGAALAAPATAPSPSGAGDSPGSIGIIAPNPKTGQEVYEVICQSCHMADGKGGAGAGAIPGVANNPRLASAGYPILLVLRGRGAMPWFYDSLSPEQIAGVVGYIRTHFGNSYSAPVTAADVTRLAPAAGRR